MTERNIHTPALYIGHGYTDNVFVVDKVPQGDEKTLAHDSVVSFGGNAVTAAFTCARLGIVPDLLSNSSDDWYGRMFAEMVRKYGLHWHERKTKTFSASVVLPNNKVDRVIIRKRDEDYLHGFPHLSLEGCKAIHMDGLQVDAAIHYAKLGREKGILTSLDGGSYRERLEELLPFIDVAVVSARLCEQMDKEPGSMLAYLHKEGCGVAGVTLGDQGMLWHEKGGKEMFLPALKVPTERIVDTNGAGDIFHGAYMYSYLAEGPRRSWEEHFKFARAAAAHAIQHLGNERSLPTIEDVARAEKEFRPRAALRVASEH